MGARVERENGSIFALKVGRTVDFDWTWEGSIAYRPGATVDDFPTACPR